MSDYFEIDFLDVAVAKSGDAIPLRYELNGQTYIHVVDGGFVDTGEKVVSFIKKYYDNPTFIDCVVATHPDGDHCGGLRLVLEEFTVGALYMHRPWLYANELIPRFSRFTNTDNLVRRLKELYPNIVKLEEIAVERGIPVHEAFQGTPIGAFTVMTPTKARYLDLVVDSDKTPEATNEASATLGGLLAQAGSAAMRFVKSAWGAEVFSPNETSSENEMSIVQYAELCGDKILLTADTGRSGLNEAADFAPFVGLALPGIDKFQVPHHGSRRNVSTETLDRWLGPRLATILDHDSTIFSGFISAAKEDKDHPRKAVERAIHHRGGSVGKTEGRDIRWNKNAPDRPGYVALPPVPYPDDQEDD
ncbi:MAG: MBL fold metallo-hydrolase [Pseudomonadota bacterium]